jgi:hypothetical protein
MHQVGPLHQRSSGRTAADIVIGLRPCRGSQREQLIRAERRHCAHRLRTKVGYPE